MEFIKKVNRQGIKRVAAALGLKWLIGIGFFAALWFLRSYSVDFCMRTLQEETLEVQENIQLQLSFTQSRLEMMADIIAEEEEITSERVLKILRSARDMGMISRLGIVLPNDQIFEQDGTLSAPVNGITFEDLAEKGSFITNVEPDNAKQDESVLFLNVLIEEKNKTTNIYIIKMIL